MSPFLTLPREIRDKIYTYVLALEPSEHAWTVNQNVRSQIFVPLRFLSNNKPVGEMILRQGFSILLVSRRIYAESCPILYGFANTFLAFEPEKFRTVFCSTIGNQNLSCIKSLEICMPSQLKERPQVFLRKYLEVLADRMTSLTNLVLVTRFKCYTKHLTDSHSRCVWSVEHGALLHTSAWITRRSSTLKLAMWEESGVFLDEYDDTDEHYRIILQVTLTKARLVKHEGWTGETPIHIEKNLTRPYQAGYSHAYVFKD